jgi:primosomal protein N'
MRLFQIFTLCGYCTYVMRTRRCNHALKLRNVQLL